MNDAAEQPRALPEELLPLLSVAAARIDRDGNLLEANAGFLRLIPAERVQTGAANVSSCFIQPSFQSLTLKADIANPVHEGLITIGDYRGKTTTLKGRVLPTSEGLCLIAEYDVEQLERIQAASLAEVNTLSELDRRLAASYRNIREQSLTDPLTGIANRRRLEEHLAREVERARRHGRPLCVAMGDIDFFKMVNDRYGHQTGDAVLVRVADVMKRELRSADLVARYGGEEFAFILPETSLADASTLFERIRKAIEATRFENENLHVTISFGVAAWHVDASPTDTLESADKALYRAKQGGRNRVEIEALAA